MGYGYDKKNSDKYNEKNSEYYREQPSFRTSSFSYGGNGPVIIIDPGHGADNGTHSGKSTSVGVIGSMGTQERNVTLNIAERVASHLAGDNVLITRTKIKNPTLAERINTAKQANATAFVSIHANRGGPNDYGPETWVHLKSKENSRRLANSIQSKLSTLSGNNRGVFVGNLAILASNYHKPSTACCLVEVDFLSHPQGEQRLRDETEINAIGRAIADGIKAYNVSLTKSGSDTGSLGTDPYPGVIVPDVDWSKKSILEILKIWGKWITDYARWRLGAPDTTFFPHSAICMLELQDAKGRTASGTGFYIGPEKVLTCGHNFVYDVPGEKWYATGVAVVPGKNDDQIPFGAICFPVSLATVHPKYLESAKKHIYNRDFDLAVLKTPGFSAPNNQYFSIIEENMCRADGIVLCGYGHSELKPNIQYMDGAHINDIFDETFNYPIRMRPGHSGSPVFRAKYDMSVIGVNTFAMSTDPHYNYGCLLTEEKIRWINSI